MSESDAAYTIEESGWLVVVKATGPNLNAWAVANLHDSLLEIVAGAADDDRRRIILKLEAPHVVRYDDMSRLIIEVHRRAGAKGRSFRVTAPAEILRRLRQIGSLGNHPALSLLTGDNGSAKE